MGLRETSLSTEAVFPFAKGAINSSCAIAKIFGIFLQHLRKEGAEIRSFVKPDVGRRAMNSPSYLDVLFAVKED